MNKIDWPKWSAVAEILSAVAIVATLLYLADQTKELSAQTKQNNDQLSSQIRANIFSLQSDVYATIISNTGGITDVLARASQGDELTTRENMQLRSYRIDVLRTMNFMFLEDPEYVRNNTGWMVSMFRSVPGAREFFEINKGNREPEYVQFVDEVVLPQLD